MQRLVLVLIYVFILIASALAQESAPASQPSDSAALLAACEKAADYSESHGGCAILVQKGGKTIFERYTEKSGPNVPHFLASGTKSFWGVVAMAAIDDKLLTLDEKVADTIVEWKTDPQKSKMTIRHLLSLTSGLMPGNDRLSLPKTQNNYAEALAVPMEADPGTRFRYGPAPYYVFGEVMTRKLAGKFDSPYAYLESRILKPIGMKVAEWRRDPTGHYLTPQGAILTAREWVKFGEFLKNGGAADGKQIIAKDTLAQCSVGSDINPAYGLTFWLNAKGVGPTGQPLTPLASNGVKDLFQAAGAFGQRLIISRSLDLVVVRFADGDRGFKEFDFLAPIGEALGVHGDAPTRTTPESRPTSLESAPTSKPTSAPTSRPSVSLAAAAKRAFERFDKNGDGKIAEDEMNPRQARFLMRADKDGDHALSESEFAEAWEDLRARLDRR